MVLRMLENDMTAAKTCKTLDEGTYVKVAFYINSFIKIDLAQVVSGLSAGCRGCQRVVSGLSRLSIYKVDNL